MLINYGYITQKKETVVDCTTIYVVIPNGQNERRQSSAFA